MSGPGRHVIDGVHIAEWSRRTGIGADTIRARLRAGWPVPLALSAKCRQGKPNRCSRCFETGHNARRCA